jgi:hypothetical protein
MNPNLRRPKHLDECAADPGEQWITGGDGHNPSPGNLPEQCREPFSQGTRPREPQLSREWRDQIDEAWTPKQHIGAPDEVTQPLGKVIPPARA